MILSDSTLRRLGDLTINFLSDTQYQPASIDLTLGRRFLVPVAQNIVTLDTEPQYVEYITDKFILPPQGFCLATTVEYLKIPNDITAFVHGRSSIGRLGLFVQNAGLIDAGFEGAITLELFNASNSAIELDAGRRICQVTFERMDMPALKPYRGKYQGQKDTQGSLIHLDK